MDVALKGVCKAFGSDRVLEYVSLTCGTGRVTSLVGENGAGKSTLFNVITGYINPDRGEVLLDAMMVNGRTPHEIACLGVGRLFQEIRVFGSLSVLANVLVGFKNQLGEDAVRGLIWPKDVRKQEDVNTAKARALLQKVGLEGYDGKIAAELSYGEGKLLAMARLLAMEPGVVLLDEPFAGIDSAGSNRLIEVVRELARCGVTVVVIEHDARVVEDISDDILVLRDGRIELSNGSGC